MNQKKTPEQLQAARLLQALQQPDTMHCEEARRLLPEFVEAEQAGEDVDTDERYRALLQHLDQCAACLDLYEAISEDVVLLTDESVPLPATTSTPPTFFAPTQQSDNAIVRVLRGLTRRFELALTIPRLAPVAASTTRQIPIFADTIADVPGSPYVDVHLQLDDTSPALFVTVQEQAEHKRWRVRLSFGEQVYDGITDANGTAQIRGFTMDEARHARQLGLFVSEDMAT